MGVNAHVVVYMLVVDNKLFNAINDVKSFFINEYNGIVWRERLHKMLS